MKTATTPADIEHVIAVITRRLSELPEGSEAWANCRLQLDLRIARLNRLTNTTK